MHSHSHINSKEYFISFLIGMVVANLAFHILPEVFEISDIPKLLIILSLAGGIAMQFILHKFLSPSHKTGNQFLVFLHIHNITDGLTIGLALLVNTGFGIFTAFAIMLHDIIHKMIGFGFLRAQGDKFKTAIIKIALTFLTITAGIILMINIKPSHIFSVMGGAFAAGSLSYIVFLLLGEVFGKTTIIPDRYAKLFKATYFIIGGIAMIILFMLLQTIAPEH